jgi:hypothetical protein
MTSKSSPKKVNYDYLPLKFLYVIVFGLVAANWESFKALPLNMFSFAAVLWALNLYRLLNRDKTSIQNEFFYSFWIRMGWATCYSLYSSGRLYSDKEIFVRNLCEWFNTTVIWTAMPLKWVEWFWGNRVLRWFVFIFDQPSANAYSFIPLFKKEIWNGELWHGILMLTSRAIARPTSQIITGWFNSNLWGKNLIKWSTIAYLNSARVLTLTLLNYLAMNTY